jgi:hypothetical protein
VRAKIVRNGVTRDAKIGNSIGKIFGITGPIGPKKSGTTWRTVTTTSSTTPGGVTGAGVVIGRVTILPIRGGGGARPAGTRFMVMSVCPQSRPMPITA